MGTRIQSECPSMSYERILSTVMEIKKHDETDVHAGSGTTKKLKR